MQGASATWPPPRIGEFAETLTGLPLMATAAWLVSVIALVSRRVRFPELPPLVAVALIAFPIELFLASLSGRLYEHIS